MGTALVDRSRFLVSSCRPARGFSSPLVGPRSRFLASSRRTPLTVSRLLSRLLVVPSLLSLTCSRFPGSSSPRAVESIHSTSRISSYSAEWKFEGKSSPRPARGFSSPLVDRSRFLVSSCRPARGSSPPLVGPRSRFLVLSSTTHGSQSPLVDLLAVPRLFLASSCRIDTLDVSNFLLFRRVEIRGQVKPPTCSRFLVSSCRPLAVSRLL